MDRRLAREDARGEAEEEEDLAGARHELHRLGGHVQGVNTPSDKLSRAMPGRRGSVESGPSDELSQGVPVPQRDECT